MKEGEADGESTKKRGGGGGGGGKKGGETDGQKHFGGEITLL